MTILTELCGRPYPRPFESRSSRRAKPEDDGGGLEDANRWRLRPSAPSLQRLLDGPYEHELHLVSNFTCNVLLDVLPVRVRKDDLRDVRAMGAEHFLLDATNGCHATSEGDLFHMSITTLVLHFLSQKMEEGWLYLAGHGYSCRHSRSC